MSAYYIMNLGRVSKNDCINSNVRFVVCNLLCLVWTRTLCDNIHQTEDSMNNEKEHEQPRHGVAHLDDWQGLRLYDPLAESNSD